MSDIPPREVASYPEGPARCTIIGMKDGARVKNKNGRAGTIIGGGPKGTTSDEFNPRAQHARASVAVQWHDDHSTDVVKLSDLRPPPRFAEGDLQHLRQQYPSGRHELEGDGEFGDEYSFQLKGDTITLIAHGDGVRWTFERSVPKRWDDPALGTHDGNRHQTLKDTLNEALQYARDVQSGSAT